MSQPPRESFLDASDNANQGVVGGFYGYMKDNAKWWLIPFVVVFLLLTGLMLAVSTGAAPFIYALF